MFQVWLYLLFIVVVFGGGLFLGNYFKKRDKVKTTVKRKARSK